MRTRDFDISTLLFVLAWSALEGSKRSSRPSLHQINDPRRFPAHVVSPAGLKERGRREILPREHKPMKKMGKHSFRISQLLQSLQLLEENVLFATATSFLQLFALRVRTHTHTLNTAGHVKKKRSSLALGNPWKQQNILQHVCVIIIRLQSKLTTTFSKTKPYFVSLRCADV